MNLAECVSTVHAHVRPDAPSAPIRLTVPRKPKPTVPPHLLQGRYPMTSEDRLKVVAFVAEHPGCGLDAIRKAVGVGVDLNCILYALNRDGTVVRAGKKYHYRYKVAK